MFSKTKGLPVSYSYILSNHVIRNLQRSRSSLKKYAHFTSYSSQYHGKHA